MSNRSPVDAFFDAMTDGEKQHMANKLHKHGHVAAKARRGSLQFHSTDDLIDALNERTSCLSPPQAARVLEIIGPQCMWKYALGHHSKFLKAAVKRTY